MFFNNATILLFGKFLWVGIALGMLWLVFSMIIKFSHKNVYVYNLLTFVFWLAFGVVYVWQCISYYNYSFCWFGLLGQLLGLILVKISIEFFFTILAKLLYNGLNKGLKRKKDGKLRFNEKDWNNNHC